ncbi:unnamed protein product [Prorocentrum cordatum]|uniref:Uncharacterized protein n=1 Tax=Prorocentrum cordatum TaxID=2364126 RepID=A0ABN9UBE8_9DINO|nr:unnamed protein product [Polarella glacialis]
MDSLLKSALKHAEKGKEWLMEDVPMPMEDEILRLAEDVKDRVADTTTAVRERVSDTAAAAAVVGETVKVEAHDLRARVARAEGGAEAARQELARLREEHAGEVARLTERRDLALEYELRATIELKALKRELAALRGDGDEAAPQSSQHRGERRPWSDEEAPSKEDLEEDLEEGGAEQDQAAADVSASAGADPPGTPAEGQPPAARGDSEAVALRERVEALEKRCVALQRKLNARPVMYHRCRRAPSAGTRRGSWSRCCWRCWARSAASLR